MNDKMPLVTVVTITYNLIKNGRADSIRQCIESVRNQTYANVEHVVIDGASTDGTLELLKEYEKGACIKLYSEPDNGVYDAMNKGLSYANGKYVNYLNSDDFFHNHKAVECSVDWLEDSGADYSFADTILLYEDKKEYVWEGDLSKILWASHYCHQSMFVKKQVLIEMNGFDTKYTVSADTDLMIRLYDKRSSWVKVPECIVTYRVGGHSSQQQQLSRKEHSDSFYTHLGIEAGLSRNDCYLLWNRSLFDELGVDDQIKIISKVPGEFGAQYLLNDFMNRFASGGKVYGDFNYYLFGFIPFLKQQSVGNQSVFKLFGKVPVFRIQRYGHKRKFFLFGFLPTLKIKSNYK